MKRERAETGHDEPTFEERIKGKLIEIGLKDSKTPVGNNDLAEGIGCTRQHVSRVRQGMKNNQAEQIPPPRPPHRPKGVSRANQSIVQALERRAKDETASRQETVAAVAAELNLGLESHGRIGHLVTRMIRKGDLPRRNAPPLTGRAREEAGNGVVRLVKRGFTNPEIAKKLKISRTQVRNLRKGAREKGRLQEGKRGRRKKKR